MLPYNLNIGPAGLEGSSLSSNKLLDPAQSQMYALTFENQAIFNQLSLLTQIVSRNQEMIYGLIKGIELTSTDLESITKYISKAPFPNSNKGSLECIGEVQEKNQSNIEEVPSVSSGGICRNIFGEKNYKFKVRLVKPFQRTLFKERNFSMSVRLVDSNDNIVVNSNRIPFTMCAYYNQDVPEVINETRLNKPVFKGNNEMEIHQGLGSLNKIQFKEVSSFYTSRGIFFVMYAKPQSLKYNGKPTGYMQRVIDHAQIRPLVITGIYVKAKNKISEYPSDIKQ